MVMDKVFKEKMKLIHLHSSINNIIDWTLVWRLHSHSASAVGGVDAAAVGVGAEDYGDSWKVGAFLHLKDETARLALM